MNILDFFKRNCTLVSQLESLQHENLQLRRRLEALTGVKPTTEVKPTAEVKPTFTGEPSPARTHEDFAGAISFAVDSLQSQMSQMSNPVSDFGLREISLQARVMMEISPLGVLTYRFVRPGDPVDPQTLSTVSMTIVPVPKQHKVGTLSPGEFKSQVGVEEIPGIDKDTGARLRQQGIYTASDFLQVGTRIRSSVKLAALLDVDREHLNEWLARAQLLMLEGVNSQTSSILFDAGIRGLKDLASLTPDDVLGRYEKHGAILGHSTLQRLTSAQVEEWIKTARTYTGALDPKSRED